MAASSTPDSFLTKPTPELLFLVQHPELYHPELVAEAGRELRRRGASLPRPATPDAPQPAPEYAEPAGSAFSAVRRWWPAGALAGLALGLGVWGWRASTTPAPAAKPAQPAGPIVLEAVHTNRLPDFEAQTAAQVADVRRQLSGPDRADTTATGRYLRMARRYWLAENAAAYLTAQAQADSVTDVFPGQVDLTIERISWFLKGNAYNQHLHPGMNARLAQMQHGLQLRRQSLQELQSRYTMGGELPEAQEAFRQAATAAAVGQELRGLAPTPPPVAGSLASLGGESSKPVTNADFQVLTHLPQTRRFQNPVYVLDGELLPSDPGTGEAPAAVRALPPDSIGRVVFMKKQAAVRTFGPRAHDGAVVVMSKAMMRQVAALEQ